MLRDITKECITVTMNERTMVFWRGIVLCETVYKEQPYEIDEMRIMLEEEADGIINVKVKTPVIEGIHDTQIALEFSSFAELNRFDVTPFDPLRRGFYPLQSKLENGSLVEITDHFGSGVNRVFIDANIMASIISNFFLINNRFPMGDEIERLIYNAYNEKAIESFSTWGCWIEKGLKLKVHVLNTGCLFKVAEDPFGEFIVIEYDRVDFKAKLRMTKHLDVRTNDIVLAINGVPFDSLRYQDSYYISQYGLKLDTFFVMRESCKVIIEYILGKNGSLNQPVGLLLEMSRYTRGTMITTSHKVISYESTLLSSISGFGSLDYEEYLRKAS